MRKSILIPIIGIFVVIFSVAAFKVYKNQTTKEKESPRIVEQQNNTAPVKPSNIHQYPLPKFIDHPPIRQVNNLGKILSDIESHMPAGHIYRDSDYVTWAHETSHGISGDIRRKHPRFNGVYVLNNLAFISKEPPIRLNSVAKQVPRKLRGDVYNLYLVQQSRYWNAEPLYVLDEFVAYTNGTLTGLEMKLRRAESTQYMSEFLVYSICLMKAIQDVNEEVSSKGSTIVPATTTERVKSKIIETSFGPEIIHPTTSDVEYHECMMITSLFEDRSLKDFLRWQITRIVKIIEDSKNTTMYSKKGMDYLSTLGSSSDEDISQLRDFSRKYFGEDWTKNFLGF